MRAIIGGSGIYDLSGVTWKTQKTVETPFGDPSSDLRFGEIEGNNFVFLPRHGAGHGLSPSHLNYRANIFALKSVGVKQIYSLSAVGSLREDIEPTHIVIPDQFVDRTRHRQDSFFGEGIVAHVTMADPFCPVLRKSAVGTGKKQGLTMHNGGTYLCMEGPQFSTKAESHLYRSWGMDIIGMTNLTEARLAREAQICYCTIALSTDYDCWHPDHDSVTVESVLATLKENAKAANDLVAKLLSLPSMESECGCGQALRHAILTPADNWPEKIVKKLGPILSNL